MYTGPDRLVEGELLPKGQARAIYNSIVNRRRDPALLEQVGEDLFRMSVFPIFGRDTKRILLDFTIPLEVSGETGTFQLPLFGDSEPIWDFRIQGRISGKGVTVNSSTYPAV